MDNETDGPDGAEALEDLEVSDEVADAVAGGKKKKKDADDPNQPFTSELSC